MRSSFDRKKGKLTKDEARYAPMWILVVIILAGIILVPHLLLMSTGLTSTRFSLRPLKIQQQEKGGRWRKIPFS